MALGVMSAFHERGVRVPEDVSSIIGFDGIPEAAFYWPPLTSVRQDFSELGRRCVAALLNLIKGEQPQASAPFAPQLVIRGSTAVPRTAGMVAVSNREAVTESRQLRWYEPGP